MPEPLTITDAAGFIRRGELTPVELLDQCLARIDRYESTGAGVGRTSTATAPASRPSG